MRTIKSHKIFLATLLLLIQPLEAQEAQTDSSMGTQSQISQMQDGQSQPTNESPVPNDASATPTEHENSKYTKLGTRQLLWVSLGGGAPGNGLDTPNTHLELGWDLPFNEWIKWGPYIQNVNAFKREAFQFSETGYSEVRKYLVSSNSIGVQSRLLLYDTWQGRLGFGFSQTKMQVKSVKTNAPIESLSVGYEKSFPLGFSALAALQRVWVMPSFNFAIEGGYNLTAVNSNESFTELYATCVFRVALGSDEKKVMLRSGEVRGQNTETNGSEASPLVNETLLQKSEPLNKDSLQNNSPPDQGQGDINNKN